MRNRNPCPRAQLPNYADGVPTYRGIEKAGPKSRLLSRRLRLAPVAFDHHPAAMTVNPAMGNPNCMLMWRTVPTPRNPYIAVPVPAVVARNPHIAVLRRRGTPFHDRCRWAHANINLRVRSHRKQSEGKQSCQCHLLHESTPSAIRIAGPPLLLRLVADYNMSSAEKLCTESNPCVSRTTLVNAPRRGKSP